MTRIIIIIIIIIIIHLLIEERMFVWYNKFDIILSIAFVCDEGKKCLVL